MSKMKIRKTLLDKIMCEAYDTGRIDSDSIVYLIAVIDSYKAIIDKLEQENKLLSGGIK